jgi:hypothetical protein
MPSLSGEKNGRWKGGTWINSSGYVMVLVGRDHPMASCRQYAKRCRLVLYETYGPPPNGGEHAHHLNGDKQDDSRYHLTSERAKKIGAKGGRKVARMRRRLQREIAEKESRNRRKRKVSQRRTAA